MIKFKLVSVLAAFLFLISCGNKGVTQQESSSKTTNTSAATFGASSDNQEMDGVAFTIIESVPVYPGCESLLTSAEKRKCMSDGITAFVSENFNALSVKPFSEIGVNRIYVTFTIDTNGEITNVKARGPSPQLQQEAVRVVTLLPKMKPGMHRGEEVNVQYSLPIVYYVEPEEKNKEEKE